MAATKVLVSPKATKTELCIKPKGGTMKPAISRPLPIKVRITAMINLIFNLYKSLIYYILRLYYYI